MKRCERIAARGFLAILFGFSVLFFVTADRSFSEQERRSLRTLPSFSVQSLLSGEFSSAMNAYFSDQFPFRDAFVGVKGAVEIALGKGENNGILLGKNGQLARRKFTVRSSDGEQISNYDGYDPIQVQNACAGICRGASSMDCPMAVLLTGRSIDVAASSFDYPRVVSDALLAEIQTALRDGVDVVETVGLLQRKHEEGEVVFYKTDHHWTTFGAYYAYAEVMKSFGMESETLPRSAFRVERVSDSFYGTLWSAGGMKWVAPDSVELWLVGNEDQFVVTADGKMQDGFYSMEWLSKKDHYSVFLDGTHDVVTVTRPSEAPRPKLLLLKDSFANALAPFLAQHFDLVLLNLSSTKQDFTNLSQLTDLYRPDRVLLVYTVENLLTADKLERLR